MVWFHIANRAKDSKDVHFSMLVYYRATYSKHFQELSSDVNHEQRDVLAVGATNTSDSEHKAPRIPTNSIVLLILFQQYQCSVMELEKNMDCLFTVCKEKEDMSRQVNNRSRIQTFNAF